MKNFKYIRKVGSADFEKTGIIINNIMKLISGWRTLDDSVLYEIKLTISELVANAILHGNKDFTKSVEIDIESLNYDTLSIEVADEGEGFNYDFKDPTEDLTKDSGRGLFIIYHICEEVIFKDNGKRIRAVKKLI